MTTAPPSLVPPETLVMMRTEAARQFSQLAWWQQQRYDPNGEPSEDSYGEKQYHDPIQVPARAVTVFRDFIGEQGYVRLQVTQWYLPPNLGVREGDRLWGLGDDPKRLPPVLSVGEVPDPVNSVYELVTTGWRSRGAP